MKTNLAYTTEPNTLGNEQSLGIMYSNQNCNIHTCILP